MFLQEFSISSSHFWQIISQTLYTFTATTYNFMTIFCISQPFLFVSKENLRPIFIFLIDRHATAVFTHLFYNGHKHIVILFVDGNKQFFSCFLLEEQQGSLHTHLR